MWTTRRLVQLLLLTLLMLAGTAWLGWWMVPVSAVLHAGLVRRTPSAPADAALAAVAAWGALLGRAATAPAFTTLLDRLGGIFPLPGVGVVALTLVLGAALGWAAARLTIGLLGVSPVPSRAS